MSTLIYAIGPMPVHAETEIYYVVSDHLGTPHLLVDENRHVVWQAEYDEFGKATILVEEEEFNLRFPGQYYDKETGLNYNYYRDYDPSTGRYVQSDPRGIMLDFSDPQRQVAAMMGVAIPQNNLLGYLNHSYGYVDQNPLIFFDYTGELINTHMPDFDRESRKKGIVECILDVMGFDTPLGQAKFFAEYGLGIYAKTSSELANYIWNAIQKGMFGYEAHKFAKCFCED